jgi:hypothetical protein
MNPACETSVGIPVVGTNTPAVLSWSPNTLTAGSYWPSFEQFRLSGSTGLEGITPGTVGTLRTKSATYRILGDQDFQKLLGLASEVHRLKNGLTVIIQAARVFARHKDRETEELLINSVSVLGGSPILPETDRNSEFRLTEEEKATPLDPDDDFDASLIPRVAL